MDMCVIVSVQFVEFAQTMIDPNAKLLDLNISKAKVAAVRNTLEVGGVVCDV